MTWVADPDRQPGSVWTFAVPLLRIRGARFMVHWSFLAYGAFMLLRSALGSVPEGGEGLAITAQVLGALFLLVLCRELVRAAVARACGGMVEEVMLWPLGALRGIEAGPGWRPAMAVALAGPCTSVFILVVLALILGLATGEWMGTAIPHPLDNLWLLNPHAPWVETLWIVQRTGLQLALLNCIPALPLDLGQAANAWVLRVCGPQQGPRVMANVSLAASSAAAVLGILWGVSTLLALGVACFVDALLALRRIRLGDAIESAAGPWERGEHAIPPLLDVRLPRRASAEERARQASEAALQRAQEQAQREALEVDRILEKIAKQGIERLTAAERRTLQRATKRRRDKSADQSKRPPRT